MISRMLSSPLYQQNLAPTSNIVMETMVFWTFSHKNIIFIFFMYVHISLAYTADIKTIEFVKWYFIFFPWFSGSFSDFGEFVARDNYFNSSANNSMNNTANNFPIGTFSIEQATQPAVSQAFPQTDYFNPATASQLMSEFPFTFAFPLIWLNKLTNTLISFISYSQRS